MMDDIINLFNSSEIYNKMQDEESKKIFKIRLEYLIFTNRDKMVDELLELIDNFECNDFREFIKYNDKGIIIFGAGKDGKHTYQILKKMGLEVVAFCDNDPKTVGTTIDEIKVISFEELKLNYGKYIILIATRKYVSNIYEQLLKSGICRGNIYYPPHRELVAETGNQYFDIDVWIPEMEEVFVDAGSYDASSSLGFIEWCNHKYKKIYIFEAHPDYAKNCEKKIIDAGIDRVKVYPYGTWSKATNLMFDSKNGSGSGIREKKGDINISVISLDEVLISEKVTFIKMDVEGSELESLKGAETIIKKNRPKLAICVYHNPNDILLLTSYIHKIVPEYKFWLRHYTSNEWETVLYASI